jgi:hypothetical protein
MDKPKVFIGNWAQAMSLESRTKWNQEINCWIHGEIGNPPKLTKLQVWKMHEADKKFFIAKPDDLEQLEYLVASPWCVYISCWKDEPDLYMPPYNSDPIGNAKYFAEQLAKDGWIAEKVAGRKPLQVTFAGSKVTAGINEAVRPYAGQNQKPWIDQMLKFPPNTGKHLIMSDWYPRNQNASRYLDTYPALAMNCLRKWFPDFDQGCFLECSDQMLDKLAGESPGRAPTVAEMDAQVTAALLEKPVVIAWFSHTFMGLPWDDKMEMNAWDGSSSILRTARKQIAKRLNPDAPVVSPITEDRIKQIEKTISEVQQRLLILADLGATVQLGLKDLSEKTVTDITLKRGV